MSHYIRAILFLVCSNCIILHAQQLAFNTDSLNGKKISLQILNDKLLASLKDSAVGWAFTIWQNNKPVFQNEDGYKVVPADSKSGKGLPFTIDTRMHIASLSKSITAIAVAKLVEMKKLGWDDKIKKFLPPHWKLHPAFDSVTIRQLVIMQSGLDAPLDALTSRTDSLKQLLERGPNPDKIGKFNYQNTNYGLLRIIIAFGTGFEEYSGVYMNDAIGEVAASQYIKFVNEHLFKPAGISAAECRTTEEEPALYYPFPLDSTKGQLTGRGVPKQDGDLTLYAGGFGWYLSAADISKLLTAVFHSKKILSDSILNQLIELKFPFNIRNGKYGNYFGTGGDWGAPLPGNRWAGIHTYFMCFPSDICVVVFINSGEGSPAGKIFRAYNNSFE